MPVCTFVRLEPSLARKPFTVTDSPTLRELRDQPRLIKPAGGPSSTSQLTILPLLSLTSMWKRAWGLIHSIFVTGPVIVFGLLRSYCAANEWWARLGTAARIKPKPAARTNEDPTFIFRLRTRLFTSRPDSVWRPVPHK